MLTVVTSYVSFRMPGVRNALEGEPIVLIENGDLIEANLKRERVTRTELAAEARQQQIADLREVRFAVLETSGHISFVAQTNRG